jgi:hypothetical protein
MLYNCKAAKVYKSAIGAQTNLNATEWRLQCVRDISVMVKDYLNTRTNTMDLNANGYPRDHAPIIGAGATWE